MLTFGLGVKGSKKNSSLPEVRNTGDFRQLVIAAGVFGLGDFSHTMLILYATQKLTPRLVRRVRLLLLLDCMSFTTSFMRFLLMLAGG
jgi:hypothetical protein